MSVRVPALQVAMFAATAACVKVEKFTFQDAAGTGSGTPGVVTATTVGGKVEVELAGVYKMIFAADRFHLPEQLIVNGMQVLSEAPAGNCVSEYGAGLNYTPAAALNAAPSTGVTAMTSNINIGLTGGVARVTLDWAGQFTGACTGAPSGRSIFSFFPDGRIQRMDAASIGSDVAATSCQACVVDSAWTIETYYGFRLSMVNAPSGIAIPGSDGASLPPTPADGTVCFTGANDAFQIAMGWRISRSKRMRRISATSVALIGDMATPGSSTGTGIIADESTTMMIASGTATGCATLRARTEPFTGDVQIKIDGQGIGLGDDGIYGGETAQNNSGGFYVAASSFLIEPLGAGAIPPFAVWLDLQDHPTLDSVNLGDGSDIAHTIQKFPASAAYLVWFPDGLAAGQNIRIVAH